MPTNVGDVRDEGLIPGWGRSLRKGNGNPLQYSSLENLMDRGAWWATVHGVTHEWDMTEGTSHAHMLLLQNRAFLWDLLGQNSIKSRSDYLRKHLAKGCTKNWDEAPMLKTQFLDAEMLKAVPRKNVASSLLGAHWLHSAPCKTHDECYRSLLSFFCKCENSVQLSFS